MRLAPQAQQARLDLLDQPELRVLKETQERRARLVRLDLQVLPVPLVRWVYQVPPDLKVLPALLGQQEPRGLKDRRGRKGPLAMLLMRLG